MQSGTQVNASHAVRVATDVLVTQTPIEDAAADFDQLSRELAEGSTMLGYSVPTTDDDLLSQVMRSLDDGPRRPSRSEVVRLGLLRASRLDAGAIAQHFRRLDDPRLAWRSGSEIHATLMAALGIDADLHRLTRDELEDRILESVDPRVPWAPFEVAVVADALVIRAWSTKRPTTTEPHEIRVLPTDTVRKLSRRLVPVICDAEEACREALRPADC